MGAQTLSGKRVVILVTQADIENALDRVEMGKSTVDDANLLRAYIKMLEGQLAAYQIGDDRETD